LKGSWISRIDRFLYVEIDSGNFCASPATTIFGSGEEMWAERISECIEVRKYKRNAAQCG
jgi:hypothetical protein